MKLSHRLKGISLAALTALATATPALACAPRRPAPIEYPNDKNDEDDDDDNGSDSDISIDNERIVVKSCRCDDRSGSRRGDAARAGRGKNDRRVVLKLVLTGDDIEDGEKGGDGDDDKHKVAGDIDGEHDDDHSDDNDNDSDNDENDDDDDSESGDDG